MYESRVVTGANFRVTAHPAGSAVVTCGPQQAWAASTTLIHFAWMCRLTSNGAGLCICARVQQTGVLHQVTALTTAAAACVVLC